MPSTKRKRFKILLDEGLPLPPSYKQLNNHHSIKHIGKTKLRGAKDKVVYELAKSENRIFVTFNTKDFTKLLEPDTPTIIALYPGLTDTQADLKICKVLRELKTNETHGYLISVTNQSNIVKRKIIDK